MLDVDEVDDVDEDVYGSLEPSPSSSITSLGFEAGAGHRVQQWRVPVRVRMTSRSSAVITCDEHLAAMMYGDLKAAD